VRRNQDVFAVWLQDGVRSRHSSLSEGGQRCNPPLKERVEVVGRALGRAIEEARIRNCCGLSTCFILLAISRAKLF
jgi:hypothetical protein